MSELIGYNEKLMYYDFATKEAETVVGKVFDFIVYEKTVVYTGALQKLN